MKVVYMDGPQKDLVVHYKGEPNITAIHTFYWKPVYWKHYEDCFFLNYEAKEKFVTNEHGKQEKRVEFWLSETSKDIYEKALKEIVK